jgi:hypothetical protein
MIYKSKIHVKFNEENMPGVYLHCADNARHPKRIASHMRVTDSKLPPPLLPFILLLVSLPFLAFSTVSLSLFERR